MNPYLFAAQPAPGGPRGRPMGRDIIQWIWGTGQAVAKPAADFSRGVVRGTPKYIPVGGGSNATQTTITASLRAGMQTRYIAREVGRAVLSKAPATGAGAVKYIARTAVRDTVIYPFFVSSKAAFYGVKFLRVTPKFLAGAERGGDKIFKGATKFLETVKLAPTVVGGAAFVARGTAYHYIEQTTGYLGDAADAIHRTARKYIARVDGAATSFALPDVPAGGIPHVFGNGQVPPAVAGNHDPAQPIPAAPPVVEPRLRSRQYIPNGGR